SSWTRYKLGISFSSRCRATTSLATIMNSSTMRCENRRIDFAIPATSPLSLLLNILIGHALLRMNNTFVKGVIEHFARTRKVHHDTQGQPVLFRIQGAKVIGNLFGKDRNHAIGEVYRR